MTNAKDCEDLNRLSWHDSKLRSFSVVRQEDDTDDVVLNLELRGVSESEFTTTTLRLKDAVHIKIEMDLEGKLQCSDDISIASWKMESELKDELQRAQFKYSPTALDGCYLFDLYLIPPGGRIQVFARSFLRWTLNEMCRVPHSLAFCRKGSRPRGDYNTLMSTQTWNASRYATNAAFVPALGQPVLDVLQPCPGERILDLGCGDGVLTEKLIAAGADVVGVDSSADMIAAARQRGIDARLMDATELTFDQEFDAVFSNAVLHWIRDDPDAAIASAYRALRFPGRFVGEMGGHGCVAAINLALTVGLERRGVKNAAGVCPWYFPTVDDYTARLERAGFVAESVELIPRPTPLPTGMGPWLETFANPFCVALPEDQRGDFLDEATEMLRPVLCDEKGRWTADYMRLRFLARKR